MSRKKGLHCSDCGKPICDGSTGRCKACAVRKRVRTRIPNHHYKNKKCRICQNSIVDENNNGICASCLSKNKKSYFEYKRSLHRSCNNCGCSIQNTSFTGYCRNCSPKFVQSKKMKVICAQCGVVFYKALSRIKTISGKHFHNTKCFGKWNSEHKIGNKHPRWMGGKHASYLRTKPQKMEYTKQYCRMRRATDIEWRIKQNLRTRLHMCLDNKDKRSAEYIGCATKELLKYLEDRWLPGMSWHNYGTHGWHIDHIRPCSSFDLTVPEQQKQCFHYTNLQPLWAVDNLRKNDKWEDA